MNKQTGQIDSSTNPHYGKIRELLKQREESSTPWIFNNDLKKYLSDLEIRALMIVDQWFKNSNSDLAKEFVEICSLAFDIKKLVPVVLETDDDKINFCTILTCYAIISNRVSDLRDYFRVNYYLLDLNNGENLSWPVRKLHSMANAFILTVIQPNGSADLSIAHLRAEEFRKLQEENEGKYYECLSMYHFVKSVELLADFMKAFDPSSLEEAYIQFDDKFQFHLTQAIWAANEAKYGNTLVLLKWIKYAISAILRNPHFYQRFYYRFTNGDNLDSNIPQLQVELHPYDALNQASGTKLHLIEVMSALSDPDCFHINSIFAQRYRVIKSIDANQLLIDFARNVALDVLKLADSNPHKIRSIDIPPDVRVYLSTGCFNSVVLTFFEKINRSEVYAISLIEDDRVLTRVYDVIKYAVNFDMIPDLMVRECVAAALFVYDSVMENGRYIAEKKYRIMFKEMVEEACSKVKFKEWYDYDVF